MRLASSDDTYGAELGDVVAHLKPFAEQVSIRGDAAARFVFAQSPQGVVELAKTSTAETFVEFWTSDSDEPAREATFPSFEDAVADAIRWLAHAA